MIRSGPMAQEGYKRSGGDGKVRVKVADMEVGVNTDLRSPKRSQFPQWKNIIGPFWKFGPTEGLIKDNHHFINFFLSWRGRRRAFLPKISLRWSPILAVAPKPEETHFLAMVEQMPRQNVHSRTFTESPTEIQIYSGWEV